MAIQKFTDILAWQKAHELTLEIYKATEKFPKKELFCLTAQILRAAISIPSNIAEGFKRKGLKDPLHFYNISEGSLEEVKYQLILCKDLGYISPEDYARISQLADQVGKILYGWMKTQK